MSEEEDQSDSDSTEEKMPTFDVTVFLENNYKLFALLSIFGAISVYIFDFQSGSKTGVYTNIGFVASQFLFLLTALSIQRKIVLKIGGIGDVIGYAIFGPLKDSLELSAFLVAFNCLVFSFVTVNLEFLSVFSFILQLIGVLFGMSLTITVLQETEKRWEWGIGVSKDNSLRKNSLAMSQVFVIVFLLILTGGIIVEMTGPITLFTLQQENWLLAVTAAVGTGIWLIGILYAFLGVLSFTIIIALETKRVGDQTVSLIKESETN